MHCTLTHPITVKIRFGSGHLRVTLCCGAHRWRHTVNRGVIPRSCERSQSQALPDDVQQRPHWQAAQEALVEVIENAPMSDPAAARTAFQGALLKEGWSSGI
jgi:hypothetical protein